MSWPFTTAIPSGHRYPSSAYRFNAFVLGVTAPEMTLPAGCTASTYQVTDWWGNIVSSGPATPGLITFAVPSGGWKRGWYRVQFLDTVLDANFGYSRGSSAFLVLSNDGRFPPVQASNSTVGLHAGAGNPREMYGKAQFGMGTSRLLITDAANLANGSGSLAKAVTDATNGNDWWVNPADTAMKDPVRTRKMWCAFDKTGVDGLTVGGLNFYVKDLTVNGATTFIAVSDGTTSGKKIVISSPDSATVVETYDNLANMDAGMSALSSSAYVRGFGTGAWGANQSATAIGNTRLSAVTQVVQTLWPMVEYYEGPYNEPTMPTGVRMSQLVHVCRLFTQAVHAGNASAKSMGPCWVTIDNDAVCADWWAKGGGTAVDEFSFHGYNVYDGGNLTMARTILERVIAQKTLAGFENMPMWETEANGNIWVKQGVFAPREVHYAIQYPLLLEQYGIPRERSSHWYDYSHGFWSFASFWLFSGGMPGPLPLLYRLLAEETWGMLHNQKLNFGYYGEKAFLGSVYRTNGSPSQNGSVVLFAVGGQKNATVTLNVTGTSSPLTILRNFGETSTVNIVNGLATVPVNELPTYVRIPAGTIVSVHHVNDWPTRRPSSVITPRTSLTSNGSDATRITNRKWAASRRYDDGASWSEIPAQFPAYITLTWPVTQRADKAILWQNPPIYGNGYSVFMDFDVQISNDGATGWATVATINNTADPVEYPNMGSPTETGNSRHEVYWVPQWVFNIDFNGMRTFKGVRLAVRSTSYAEMPSVAACNASWGSVWLPMSNNIQEFEIIATDTAEYTIVR